MARRREGTRVQKNFSIQRSPIPVIIRCISIIALSDAVFMLLIFLLIALRNAAGLEVVFIGLVSITFVFKTALTIAAVYLTMNVGLSTIYYVRDGALVLEATSKDDETYAYTLSDVHSLKISKGTLGSMLDYGDIVLIPKKSYFKNDVVLHDVRYPDKVARSLKVAID